MNYWLIKTDPDTYSWDDFKKDRSTYWDGVRNYQARNYLKDMKEGDIALFYHSVQDKIVTGTARISKAAYQDPTTDDDRWVAVDVEILDELATPVSLGAIKDEATLSDMVLVNNTRLSVQPVTEAEYKKVIEMGA
jgi:predicted RNA-binding protein with PUA-like domain